MDPRLLVEKHLADIQLIDTHKVKNKSSRPKDWDIAVLTKRCVDQMSVVQMSVYQMSVDQMSVDQLSVELKSVGQCLLTSLLALCN
jgi:hypothetical protein